MPTSYIRRIANHEPSDYQIIRLGDKDKGLRGKGFSAVIRLIVREWGNFTRKRNTRNKTNSSAVPKSRSNDSPPLIQYTDPNAPNFIHPPFP